MQTIIVKYRERDYYIYINTENTILDLKMDVSERSGIKHEKFSLKQQEIICCDDKKISEYIPDKYIHYGYIRYDTVFTMTDVRISITVILNGARYTYYYPEHRRIVTITRQIIKLVQHTNEISLLYNGKKLESKSTLLSSGVEQGCILTAVDGKPIINTITSLTINYRDEMFPIDIDKTKTVFQLTEAISELTGIETGNFCLRIGQIYLLESKMIEEYIKDGTTFTMKNVIIKILVELNGIENICFVSEEEWIHNLKKEIKSKFRQISDITLYNNSGTICRSNTLVTNGIKNGDKLIAVSENFYIREIEQLTVVYRHESYLLSIATNNTVLQLKQAVSDLTEINVQNFTLQLHWMSLVDTQPIAEYMKFGTNLRMTNVKINVAIRFDGQHYHFYVPEEMTIKDFKEEIVKKTKHKTDLSLSYQGKELAECETLSARDVLHNATVIVISKLRGGYK